MRKGEITAAVVTVGAVCSAYALVAPPDRPARPSNACTTVPGTVRTLAWRCGVTSPDLHAGTVHVDASANAHSAAGVGALALTGSVTLTGPDDYRCSLSFPADGRLHSFTCAGAPAGGYSATVYGGVPLQVGIRQ